MSAGMDNKKVIAQQVKNVRIAKGYTQQELSDLVGISLRSVQRIENGEVLPRSYTLKLLAERLELPLAQPEEEQPLPEAAPVAEPPRRINRSQQIILTFSSALVLFLLTIAFIAQSHGFPETQFELFLLLAGVISFYAFLLFRIWR